MSKVSTLGIDLAKSVFQLHGIAEKGQVVLRKTLRRSELKEFIVNLPLCLIGMEACGGAHYWARMFKKYGHTVKLMNPKYVKAYVKTNKNDKVDAEAICEAVGRLNMRFVPIKETWQEDIQMLHRIRERRIHNRTALCNQIRGLLAEYGVIIAQGVGKLERELPFILEDATNELTTQARDLFSGLLDELKALEVQISQCDREIDRIHQGNELCQRIAEIEGIGPISATALIATVADARVFKNGRQLSAYLGLVPRHSCSGGKSRMGRISKRGNPYIRKNLIHGARSVLQRAHGKTDARSRWLVTKEKTRGFNKACVALANKNARIAWALLVHGTEYRKAS